MTLLDASVDRKALWHSTSMKTSIIGVFDDSNEFLLYANVSHQALMNAYIQTIKSTKLT